MIPPHHLAEVLADLARKAAAGCTREDVLRELCDGAARVLPVDGAGVIALDHGTAEVVTATSQNVLDLARLEVRLHEGPSIDVRRTEGPVRIPDVRARRQWNRFAPHALAAGMHSVTALPLCAHGHLTGTLELYRQAPEPLDELDLAAARTLVQVAASYLTILDQLAAARTSERDLARGVLYDPLTGLPSPALTVDRLQHAVACARRRGRAVVVMALHLVPGGPGAERPAPLDDELVVEITKRLGTTLRAEDTLARDDMADFVVICNDVPEGRVDSHAEAASSRVRRAFARPFLVAGAPVALEVRIGVAWGHGEAAAEDLLRAARADVPRPG